MIERERRDATIKELMENIKEQENRIISANNAIRVFKNQIENLPCSHKKDNGESALKDDSYWVKTGINNYIDSWTGENETEILGYTHYGKVCTICDEEFE